MKGIKRLLIPLIAALALPSVNANSNAKDALINTD